MSWVNFEGVVDVAVGPFSSVPVLPAASVVGPVLPKLYMCVVSLFVVANARGLPDLFTATLECYLKESRQWGLTYTNTCFVWVMSQAPAVSSSVLLWMRLLRHTITYNKVLQFKFTSHEYMSFN
eukprot:GILK01009755.1.p2 GENE.GILK01009755.1~~GILK01009755.1.p2  ORF type:complete len:124 (+),score=5.90 GILK01009755.1:147-518(+)